VALYLSQHASSLALEQAERFKSINQMTAFLTHDLKTLLSQLFLLVENGKIHKNNPAFIDDMLNTLEHVSQKMQRLVQQLKEPMVNASSSGFHVLDVLRDILDEYRHNPVKPQLINNDQINPEIHANKSELQSALKHIIQNATESVQRNGLVKIELCLGEADQVIIKISDNGKGMSTDFIANRLFRPFDSTKGVSGMGIGVYQSREYIRSLGGEVQVSSKEGTGTTFTITLPLNNEHQ
jgi:putative PEP-CTERM system histidine kinase